MFQKKIKTRTKILLALIFCIGLFALPNPGSAEQKQQFICSAPTEQGNIYASGSIQGSIPIPANGVIEIPVGETVVFYEIAQDGYRPYGFILDGVGQTIWNYLSYTVTPQNLGAPKNVMALFSQAKSVEPYVKILSPSKSSITVTGPTATISISGRYEFPSSGTIEVYKNDSLIASTNKSGSGNWSFSNLPLIEGDNVFMVKTQNYRNYGVDMLLVHYSRNPLVDNVKAVVLIDERLYKEPAIQQKLNEYINLSMLSLGSDYKIFLDVVNGIDDWTTDEVRNHILRLKNDHPLVEGVFFIGNIKLPSFYAPNDSALQSRLISHKYEDLDIVLRKNNPAVRADSDYMNKGENPLPELWAAFVPVGYSGGASENEYRDFAVQVVKFLDKAISQRKGTQAYTKLYKVSNQLWDLGGIVAEVGLSGVDFYGVNDTGYAPYGLNHPLPDPALFYKKAPLESFAAFKDFWRYYQRFPWMGEDWQKDYIYLEQLRNQHYAIVWVNTHGNGGWSIINTAQAKSLTNGGLILFAPACSVAEFRQYGSRSYNDSLIVPDTNLLCGYLYGNSDFLAALGDPFNRVHEPEYNRLGAFLFQGDYLGLAHFFRKCIQYHNVGSENIKGITQEILLGDPFIVIQSPPQPDLAISDIRFYNSAHRQVTRLVAGQTVTCRAVLINQGQVSTGRSFNVLWKLDDANLSARLNHGALNAGETSRSSACSYVWTPTAGNHTLRFDVDSDNQVQESNEGNNSLEKNFTIDDIPPARPTNLVATAISPHQVNLTWQDNSNNESGFKIQRSLYPTWGFTQIGPSLDANTTTYSDSGLNPGTTYYYRVKAYNNVGAGYSNTTNATPSTPQPPIAPSNLTATAISQSQINLTWQDNSTNETGFKLERSTSISSGFTQIVQPPANATSYQDTGLVAGTTYYYRIKATNAAGDSGYSTANATTQSTSMPPAAPSHLTATAISPGQINLTWRDNSMNETGFKLERSLNTTSGFSQIATTDVNVTRYSNTGLAPGTIYYYRVRAYNTVGESVYSNVAEVNTLTGTTKPDIAVVNIKFYNLSGQEITNLVANQDVICKATVSNQGGSSTYMRFVVKWIIDKVEITRNDHPPLAAGQISKDSSCTYRWKPTKGNHIVTFWVDYFDYIKEDNEANNIFTIFVSVP